MPDWFYGLILALIAAMGGWLSWQTTRRAGDREELRDLHKRMDDQRRRIERLENYAANLREHIYASKGPPPPDWPGEAP